MFGIRIFQPFGGVASLSHAMNILLITTEQKLLKARLLFFNIELSTQKLGWRCNQSDCCIFLCWTTWIVTPETTRGLWQPRLHQQLFEMLFEPSGAKPWLLHLRGSFFECLPLNQEMHGNTTLEFGELILTSHPWSSTAPPGWKMDGFSDGPVWILSLGPWAKRLILVEGEGEAPRVTYRNNLSTHRIHGTGMIYLHENHNNQPMAKLPLGVSKFPT